MIWLVLLGPHAFLNLRSEGRWVFPSVPHLPRSLLHLALLVSEPPRGWIWVAWFYLRSISGMQWELSPMLLNSSQVTTFIFMFGRNLKFVHSRWGGLTSPHREWVSVAHWLKETSNNHSPKKKSTKIHTILILSRADISKLFLKMLHKGHIKLILELQSEMC